MVSFDLRRFRVAFILGTVLLTGVARASRSSQR